MKRAYIQPDIEIFTLKALEDFLLLSPTGPEGEEDDDENGDLSGSITPDRPGIWD